MKRIRRRTRGFAGRRAGDAGKKTGNRAISRRKRKRQLRFLPGFEFTATSIEKQSFQDVRVTPFRPARFHGTREVDGFVWSTLSRKNRRFESQ